MVAVVAVSGCTTTEQDVVGGGLIGDTVIYPGADQRSPGRSLLDPD
nr:hypothetical protein [Mesorhizobium sp.]